MPESTQQLIGGKFKLGFKILNFEFQSSLGDQARQNQFSVAWAQTLRLWDNHQYFLGVSGLNWLRERMVAIRLASLEQLKMRLMVGCYIERASK